MGSFSHEDTPLSAKLMPWYSLLRKACTASSSLFYYVLETVFLLTKTKVALCVKDDFMRSGGPRPHG